MYRHAPEGYDDHVHLFPRWEGDDLYRSPYRLTAREERRPYAERVRTALRLPAWPTSGI
jgi:diadenosine tetraphosphate (Ap4A) HIT family hydrolase